MSRVLAPRLECREPVLRLPPLEHERTFLTRTHDGDRSTSSVRKSVSLLTISGECVSSRQVDGQVADLGYHLGMFLNTARYGVCACVRHQGPYRDLVPGIPTSPRGRPLVPGPPPIGPWISAPTQSRMRSSPLRESRIRSPRSRPSARDGRRTVRTVCELLVAGSIHIG
jgi:hypothetical protein